MCLVHMVRPRLKNLPKIVNLKFYQTFSQLWKTKIFRADLEVWVTFQLRLVIHGFQCFDAINN